LSGTDATSLQIPDGFDIFAARFGRDGDDLVISAEGGQPLTVVDYFTLSTPPALVAPSGAMLTGDVVALLAGPRAPAQYAQADAPEGATPIGQVETLSGSSTATRVTGETVELGRGDPVFQGDVIETGADSTLGIRLEDGTLASLSAQSRLVLNEFVFETGGSDNWMLVNLVEGAFAFLTGAIAPSGGMEITTPVAVMAIRGTMPIAFVSGDDGATQFFAGSDKDYELLHLTTREILAVVSSASGISLTSPDAAIESIELDPDTLDDINNLLDVLNEAAASLGLLGIQADSGFHIYSPFGNIDGNLAALIEFLLLLDGALAEGAVVEVADSQQFLMAEAQLIANPDQAVTEEMRPVEIDVLANDIHPEGGDLTVIFADVPNGQGTVSILDGRFVVFDPGSDFEYLSLGETTDVIITYVITNGSGAIASSTVTVTVTGLNEPPVIVPEATTDTGALTELENQTGSDFLHEVDGTIAFADVDLNDIHSADFEPDGPDYLGSFELGAVDPVSKTVTWTFSVVDADIDHLPEGEIRTQTYTVTIDDGQGGTVEHVVTITITGTNDAPVIIIGDGDSDSADLVEHDDALDADGTLTVRDVSVSDVVTARVVEVEASGDHHTEVANETLLGFMTVSSPVISGDDSEGTLIWKFHSNGEAFDFLADGEELVLVYTIEVDDGTTTTTFDVTITIAGTNDAPVISVGGDDSAAAGLTESDVGLQAQGSLSASDLDISDEVTATVDGVAATGDFSGEISEATLASFLTVSSPVIADGNTAGTLTWTFNSGEEAFDFLAKDEKLVLTYTVLVDDGNGGIDTHEVVITITGTNDAPVIDVEESVVADTVVEAGLDADQNTVGNPIASGQIEASDVDNGAVLTYSVATAVGLYGTFSIDAATGAWTYTLDDAKADHLALGESEIEVFTVTVTDEHGASDEVDVTITVTGSNDAPVTDDVSGLSGFAGTAIEITLSGSDVDGTVSFFKITTAPTDGGLFLDAEGLTPVDPDNIPASGNEATIYFIPDSGVSGDVTFQYAAVDNHGAEDQTPASVEISVETAKIYLMIHQDSWQGGADLPTFQDFRVTIGGITYNLGDLTVVDSNFYQEDNLGFTLGVGIGSGSKERYVIFEIDGVPGGGSVEISFDYKITDAQGESFRDGIRFFAGDNPDDMVLVYDGDEDPAFTGNDKNTDFSARVLSFNYAFVAGAALTIEDVELTAPLDPIILDLGAPGIDLSATTTFDLTDDGRLETLAWTGGEDGILVMDLDGSGAIESGNEVFSPFFNGGGFADALAALASLDTNGDGVIDAADEAFADLLVWIDSNGDGVSQPDELFSLADLGIASLNLNAEDANYQIDGQTVIADGQFTRDDGTIGKYVAVELNEIFASSKPLVSGDEGSEVGVQGQLFALSNLSIHDVIADYGAGDIIDLTKLGFELATGQFTATAAGKFVQYDPQAGDLFVGGATQSVMAQLTGGSTTDDVVIV
jgi:VCBS repeat-containing protein